MTAMESRSRNDWRAQVQEEAIDPDRFIIDPHHHIYPEAPAYLEKYDVEDLIADVTGSGHNVAATVHVESSRSHYRTSGPEGLRPVGETEYVQAVAVEASKRGGNLKGLCAGIVAHANLMMGDAVEDVLVAHKEAAPDRLRGIRQQVAYDEAFPFTRSSPQMMSDPNFRRGLARLRAHGLSFDVWVFHPQLCEVAELASAFSDTKIILNHIGTPLSAGSYVDHPEEAFAQWRKGMALVAQAPNVFVKIGGMNMPMTNLGCPPDAPRPWNSEQVATSQRGHVLTCIDLFGAERCMMESNFPVDRTVIGATTVWNAMKRMTADFSEEEKDAMFSGNAAHVYSI